MKKFGKVLIIFLIIVIALIGTLCYGYFRKATYEAENPIVTIEVADYGTIKLELYPDKAQNTVENFIALINSGYYNGLTFYSIDDLFVQAGDGTGQGTGSAKLSSVNPKIEKDSSKDTTYAIKAEAYYNGYTNNDLPLEEGYVAMSTSYYSMDSASSEFFIATGDYSQYNGYYAVFGKVIDGMDVVKKISEVERKTEKDEKTGETKKTSEPNKEIVITKITVDEKNGNYGVPKTIEAFDYYEWLMQYYGIDMNAINAQ